jgi:hypothetical protein
MICVNCFNWNIHFHAFYFDLALDHRKCVKCYSKSNCPALGTINTIWSMHLICNFLYTKCMFWMDELGTKLEANSVHVWRTQNTCQNYCVHFCYWIHNISGTGFKWKYHWCWLYTGNVLVILWIPCSLPNHSFYFILSNKTASQI